jgi:hypothetical protein
MFVRCGIRRPALGYENAFLLHFLNKFTLTFKVTLLLLWLYGLLLGLWRFFSSWSYIQSVGLLRRVISPSQGRYLHTELYKQNKRTQTSMPLVGFEPTISAFDRAKTVHALGRAATAIDLKLRHFKKIVRKEQVEKGVNNTEQLKATGPKWYTGKWMLSACPSWLNRSSTLGLYVRWGFYKALWIDSTSNLTWNMFMETRNEEKVESVRAAIDSCSAKGCVNNTNRCLPINYKFRSIIFRK